MAPVATVENAASGGAVIHRLREPRRRPLGVYTIDVSAIPSNAFRRETFAQRQDAERFIDEVRGDDPEAAAKLRIEERELEAGGLS